MDSSANGIRLDEVLKDQQFGETRVVDARQVIGPIRYGRQVIFLDLVLSDSPTGSWPSADVASLRQRTSQIATDEGITISLHVSPASRPSYRDQFLI